MIIYYTCTSRRVLVPSVGIFFLLATLYNLQKYILLKQKNGEQKKKKKKVLLEKITRYR